MIDRLFHIIYFICVLIYLYIVFFLKRASRSICELFVKCILFSKNSSSKNRMILHSSGFCPLFENRSFIFTISRLIDRRIFFLISLKSKTSLGPRSTDQYRTVLKESAVVRGMNRTIFYGRTDLVRNGPWTTGRDAIWLSSTFRRLSYPEMEIPGCPLIWLHKLLKISISAMWYSMLVPISHL